MTDRTELLESALDSLPDGIALFGVEGEVVFWNQAAEAITGYAGAEVLARPIAESLEPLLDGSRPGEPGSGMRAGCGALVHARHKLGHELQAITRTLVLRDGLGGRIGSAAVFHPVESLDALPHGQTDEDEAVETSQADLEDRLRIEFDDFEHGGPPFGVLWINVDQAHELRKTHGAGACEAMLEKVHRALAQGLRPGEEIGRWGDDEFLIMAHERTPEMLAAHAHALAGLARTADFRWWGDRVSLTVSIGAAQAEHGQTGAVAELLESAQAAIASSIHAGGNSVTLAAKHFQDDCASGAATVAQARPSGPGSPTTGPCCRGKGSGELEQAQEGRSVAGKAPGRQA
jgi:diguanylate cyclase (GGDEF)-like protein/PAS domain S-box-containing protein